jgi:filamentous hemagglutinin family protein
MSRIYRLIWNRVTNTWVAVSENAKRRGKSGRGAVLGRKAMVAALSLACAPLAYAGQSVAEKQPEIAARVTRPCVPPGCNVTTGGGGVQPIGGQVVSGKGSIAQSGDTTTIRQSSQDLLLNWQSFNIGAQESVDFLQPSASAIAVNRILGTNGSQILGHLDANGQVWLINPNGVLFGQGAQVNVGGLVASALGVSDLSLSSNTISFSGNGTGSIVNQGTISAANGGYVAFLGNHVSNQGTITAKLGTVALGAGSAATLTFSGDSLVKMQVDQSTLHTLAENGGLVQADGGTVIMSAGAKNALLASVVNNTGVIEARTVENHNGTIELLGGMAAGTVNVGGTLDASAPNGGNGGFIETSAVHVEVANDAKVTTLAATGKTGTWLIDPTDFTVAPGISGDMNGATLSGDLNSTNFTILSSNGLSGYGWRQRRQHQRQRYRIVERQYHADLDGLQQRQCQCQHHSNQQHRGPCDQSQHRQW